MNQWSNGYGAPCSYGVGDWCGEWGLGGRYLGILPSSGNSHLEAYPSGWHVGATATIRVGPTRLEACGF